MERDQFLIDVVEAEAHGHISFKEFDPNDRRDVVDLTHKLEVSRRIRRNEVAKQVQLNAVADMIVAALFNNRNAVKKIRQVTQDLIKTMAGLKETREVDSVDISLKNAWEAEWGPMDSPEVQRELKLLGDYFDSLMSQEQ